MTLHLNDVQKDLIAKLKSAPSVTGLLANPLDIREVEWQGTNFGYPNIRVRVDEFERHEKSPTCGLFDVAARILIFADDASSMLVNDVGSAIFDLLDTVSFSGSVAKLQGVHVAQAGAGWAEEGGAWQGSLSLTFRASLK